MIPELFSIGPLTIHSFGVMAAIAFLTTGYLLEKEMIRVNRDKEVAGNIMLIALLGGILGSKIYYLVEYPELLAQDLWGNIFSGAGLVWYGGLIGGFLSVTAYIYKKNVPFLLTGDLLGPLLLLGQGIGRIGCFLAGDGDYGPPSDLPWAMSFPNGVVPTMVQVHPTPLYDFIFLFLLFMVLWKLRTKNLKQGIIFGLFAVFMGVERFITEFWRTDPNVFFNMFSMAQFISVILILTGTGLIYYVNKIKK